MMHSSMMALVLLAGVSMCIANEELALPVSVLHRDDECLENDGMGNTGNACAVNALQKRSSVSPKEQDSAPVDVKEKAELEGPSVDVKEQEESVPEVQSTVADVKEQETAPEVADGKDNESMPEHPVDVKKHESKRVLSWEQLKKVVEGSKKGESIHIPKDVTLTFKGTININEDTHFKIWSEGATLDGQNTYGRVRLFYVRGSLDLSGFVVENGKTDFAGAAYFDFGSKGRFSNCSFRNNEASYMGGAIVAKGAHITLDNVTFQSNSAKNTCSSKHCSRRRRNSRKSNAMYLLSHSKLDAFIPAQAKSQDIFFDNDFDGRATFHCTAPSLGATNHLVARKHIHMVKDCNTSGAAGF